MIKCELGYEARGYYWQDLKTMDSVDYGTGV